MSQVMEGPFKGHLWAEPSVAELQALMRHVISNVEEAKAKSKGKQARKDMITNFSPEIVAGIIA
ncbi:putative glycosyltransferase, partial [Corchorus olitorius]